jgi:5,6-dimethylbenzimidazole synthase
VSIFDPQALARLLQMPEGAHPLGVLCLGPVDAYYAEPMLQQEKWACRAPLEDMLMDDLWDARAHRRWRPRRQRLHRRVPHHRMPPHR